MTSTTSSAFRATDTRVMSRPALMTFVACGEEEKYPSTSGPSVGFHRGDLDMDQQRLACRRHHTDRTKRYWEKMLNISQDISRKEAALCLHHLVHEACEYQKQHKDALLAIFKQRASQAKQQQQQRARSSSLSSRGKIRAQNIASSKGVPLLLFLSQCERKLHDDVDLLLHPTQEQGLREYANSAVNKLHLFAIPTLEEFECPLNLE